MSYPATWGSVGNVIRLNNLNNNIGKERHAIIRIPGNFALKNDENS